MQAVGFSDLEMHMMAGGAGWTPDSPLPVSGLFPVTWLKTDTLGVSDGAPVTTWPNAAAGAGDAITVSSGAPIYRAAGLNGLGVLEFAVAEDRMAISPWTHLAGKGGCAYAFVGNWTTGSNNVAYYSPQIVFQRSANNIYSYVGVLPYYGLFDQLLRPWMQLLSVFDGSKTGNTNRLRVWSAGVPKTLTYGSILSSALPVTAGDLVISYLGGAPFVGQMAEILIYDATPHDDDIGTLNAYLATKWGI